MIGVVVPAFNAEATVGPVVRGARRHLDRVLVVDDGSEDATARRAEEAGAEVLRHGGNRGKGAALSSGFDRWLNLGAEAVITLDADLQHDPDDIPSLVGAFRGSDADLVVGSREAAFDRMTPGRRFGNRFSCSALQFFTGLTLPDSQCGYRLYAARFLTGLRLKRHAYDAEMELLMHAARRGSRIVSMPVGAVEADGRATSSFRPWVDTYRICRTVVLFSVCSY